MMFSPIHMFLIGCVTAAVAFLVGKAWHLGQLERANRLVASLTRENESLKGLCERAEEEREVSEVRLVAGRKVEVAS
jgi:hypothetical protein